MAEQVTNIVSFQIEGFEQAEKLKLELKELQKVRKDLDAQNKAGTISAEAYGKAIGENAKEQHKLSVSIAETNLVAKNNVKVTDAQTGSINQLRAQLALNTKAWNEMSAAERDTSAGQALRISTLATQNQLKALEKGIGDTRRNVGNYKDSILDAFREMGTKGGGALQSLASGASGASSAFASFGAGLAGGPLVAALTLLPTLAGAVTSAFGQMDDAFLPLEASFAGFKVRAILAFTETSEALDRFTSKLAGTNKEITDQYRAESEAYAESVERVKKGTASLAEEIRINTLEIEKNNRNAAIGTRMSQEQLVKYIEESNAQITKSYAKRVKDETFIITKGAEDAVKAIDSAEDNILSLRRSSVGKQKEIEQQMTLSADRTLDRQTRLDAINKAKAIDLEITKSINEEEAKLAAAKIKTELGLTGNKDFAKYFQQATFTAKEIEAIGVKVDALAEKGKLGFTTQEKLNTLLEESAKKVVAIEQTERDKELQYNAASAKIRNGIIADQLVAQRKAEEERKAADALELANARKLLQLRLQVAQSAEEEYNAKKAQIEFEAKQDVKADPKNEALILQAKEAALAKLQKEFNAKQEAEYDSYLNELKAMNEKAYNDDLAEIESYYAKKNLAIQQGLADGVLTQEDAQLQELQNTQAHLEALRQLAIEDGKSTADLDNKLLALKISNNQKKVANDKATAEKQRQIEVAQFNAARNLFNGFTALSTALMGNTAEAAEFQKNVAVANAFIDSGVAIANVVRIASQSSFDPVTFGIEVATMVGTVLGSIANAISIINTANAPEPPSLQKFEQGGYVGGKRHSQGGTIIEAEAGEYVVSRPAMAMFGSQVDYMNKYAQGQVVSTTAANTTNKISEQDRQVDALVKAVSSLPPSVLKLTEFDRANARRVIVSENARI